MFTGLPRATSMLQQAGLLLLWLISTLRDVWFVSCPKGDVWLHFELLEAALS